MKIRSVGRHIVHGDRDEVQTRVYGVLVEATPEELERLREHLESLMGRPVEIQVDRDAEVFDGWPDEEEDGECQP